MATSVMSQQQSSHTMMTQSYQREVSQKSFSVKSPDGELKDVEADFQSLVNEMARDGGPSKRVIKQEEQRAFSSSSQFSMKNTTSSGKTMSQSSKTMSSHSSTSTSGSGRPAPLNISNPLDGGIVTAMPARVVPDGIDYTERGGGESEVVVETSMKVRDRIKKLEKQLSTEDLVNSPVPDAIMSPRYKSSSIKNLADQFNNAQGEPAAPVVNAQAFGQSKDSVELINNSEFRGVRQIASVFDRAEISSQEDLSMRRVEGDFKSVSVKDTATMFQEPIQLLSTPIRASPLLRSESEPVVEQIIEPVAVLPPATMRKAPSSPPPPRPAMPTPATMSQITSITATSTIAGTKKTEDKSLAEDLKGFEDALTDMTKYAETLSTDSTESRSTSAETVVQQPIQYSAKVTCEVRSRLNTPEMVDNNPFSSSSSNSQQNTKSISETKITRKSRSETRTSSTTGSTTSISSSASNSRGAMSNQKTCSTSTGATDYFSSHTASPILASPTSPSSIAASTGKPPISDTYEGSKFSLLRSSSMGSVAADQKESKTMTRLGSEKDLPNFNIKKFRPEASRVWSPCRGSGGGRGRAEERGPTKMELVEPPSFCDAPQVWMPSRAGSASPSLGRKEYRKVAYDGSTLQRRPSQENVSGPRPEESFAWKDKEAQNLASGLPRSQNPTVTLLQKKRDGQIPSRRPEYLPADDSLYKPSDKLYTIKREYESEDDESGGSRRFAVLGPRRVEGVGPTTKEGIPVSLKTGIKSEHQGEWYRKMFDSLHKVKDDSLTHRLNRGVRYGSSGYMSEPEGYESDYGGGSSRYSTLDRRSRRGGAGFDWDGSDTTLSRNVKRYIHQPGRIENYVPGFSSLSDKELRANPEVEYKVEARNQDPPRGSSNHRYNGQRMQMTHALKESGYESDSTLLFRKQSERRPENRDISELYRQIQRGGEVPLEGLRKLAPRKPKDPVIGPLPFPYLAAGGYGHCRPADSPYKYDTSEVNIHYKTPVRIEQKEHIPDEELARRQEEHMRRVYEQERRKKYLSELEDIERRRHTDNFTPLQKSPIPLNRYDDDPHCIRGTKQIARALFNFNAQNKRELSFSKGDIISVRRQIDKNWQEGELKGLVGIFPSNYVEILPVENLKSHSRKPSEGHARARFAFQAQTAMEMSFSKGETVVLTRRVDENWYEGKVGQRRGIFPVSYVDVLVEPGDKRISPSCSPLPRPALPSSAVMMNGAPPTNSAYSTMTAGSVQGSNIETRTMYTQQLSVNTQQDTVPYRALYNYKPQNEDELELSEGDVVMVMEKCDDGWYVGTSRRTSLFGTFPGNYVEKMA